MKGFLLRNDRGVALLIVLLVTALLVALVFEFAYATRVSLRAAVNFRDSQRAYYLARSGVNVAGRLLAEYKKNGKLQDHLEQREWQPVPLVDGLSFRWEDECGKINIGFDQYNMAYLNRDPWNGWFRDHLEYNGISKDVADKIKQEKSNKINMISELYRFLSDEEYIKVEDSFTVHSDGKININTASENVIKSIFKDDANSVLIIRNDGPIANLADTNSKVNKPELYSTTSDYFRVQSRATVGEYTQVVEAVIKRDTVGFSILSWRLILE